MTVDGAWAVCGTERGRVQREADGEEDVDGRVLDGWWWARGKRRVALSTAERATRSTDVAEGNSTPPRVEGGKRT